MEPVVPRGCRGRELFGQPGQVAGHVLVRSSARDEIEVPVVELRHLDGVPPVAIGMVGGGDLLGVTLQRGDTCGNGLPRHVDRLPLRGQDMGGHRAGRGAGTVRR